MTEDPLHLLSEWLDAASTLKLRVPHACVLSTTGLDGAPNARSVAIKEVTAAGMVVTGSTGSRKGRELAADPRCAVTVWWDELGRQVRIQGVAAPLARAVVGEIFAARSREARLSATVSRQGEPLVGDELESRYAALAATGTDPQLPDGWGGWEIAPHRVEFMEFSDSRFHHRTLYTHEANEWVATRLQP